MDKKIESFLLKSNEVKKVLDENLVPTNYQFSYFEMDREEFLDVFGIRLEISESRLDGKGMGNPVFGLRILVENVLKSTSDENILCICVKMENEIDSMAFYCNVSLTELYGYIK